MMIASEGAEAHLVEDLKKRICDIMGIQSMDVHKRTAENMIAKVLLSNALLGMGKSEVAVGYTLGFDNSTINYQLSPQNDGDMEATSGNIHKGTRILEQTKRTDMRLTEEQYMALLPYKQNFSTAVNSKWARNPGSSGLDLIHRIHMEVIGRGYKLNKGCSHCIMRLLTEMGEVFLADYEERVREAIKESLTTEPVKVEDKPKRKYTRKPKKS